MTLHNTDKLADLVERLNERALDLHSTAWGRSDGGQECTISATLAGEAATALTTLQARLDQVTEALTTIAERPGAGMAYTKGVGEYPIDEAENMAVIAREALVTKGEEV